MKDDDDDISLEARIRKLEHMHYSEVIRKFEEGKVSIVGRRVIVS